MTKVITYNGTRVEFMDLIDKKNLWMHFQAIRRRMDRGWSAQRAFDTPIKSGTWKRKNTTNEQAKEKYYKFGKKMEPEELDLTEYPDLDEINDIDRI